MGKLRQTALILGEGPTEFFYFKSLCDIFKSVTIKPDYPKHTSMKELEAKIAAELKAAEDRAAKLAEIGTVTILAKAGDEGKLFGSIGTRDIADALTAAGCEIHKSEVRLPEGVLRSVGEYEIALQLHADVKSVIKLVIAADK